MVRMRRWRKAAMALVLSLILVVNVTHLTAAKSSRLQQMQRPRVGCSTNVSMPQLGKGQQVLTTVSINCSSTTSLEVTTRLEMKVGDSWVTLNQSTSSSRSSAATTRKLSATASENCPPQQTRTYRGVGYGSYEDESGWHSIPSASPEVSLKCK